MTILGSLPRIEEHRVSVVFDCPKCRATQVRGTAYNLRETIRVSSRVPNWGWSSHWVRCSKCQADLATKREPKTFQGASAATVTNQVHPYYSFPNRVMAVAGLVLSWAPLVGVMVAVASMMMNLKTRGWPRLVSIVALVLTTLYNALLFGFLTYWSLLAARPITG